LKVLTELDLREKLRDIGSVKSYTVPRDTILTPAARSFLNDKRIQLVFSTKDSNAVNSGQGNNSNKGNNSNSESDSNEGRGGKFVYLPTGMRGDEKPESFTHLVGNKLVPKTHPQIKFRGKIDSLESYIIIGQIIAEKLKMKKLAEDLGQILGVVRNLMRAAVLSEPMEEVKLFGMSEDDIKKISHNPKKFAGTEHFMPAYEMGEMMAWLNLIRAQIRESELAACEAFFDEMNGPEREDIIKTLNRLSSAAYVLMCWLKAGKYRKTGEWL